MNTLILDDTVDLMMMVEVKEHIENTNNGYTPLEYFNDAKKTAVAHLETLGLIKVQNGIAYTPRGYECAMSENNYV